MFKHALIQEVVYSSLLKKDRQAMHQQIGLVMEQVFDDRLPEFYETLAFHFRHSELSQKAVDYLRKSGRKSLKKYAVQESHQYYHRAFEILDQTLGDSDEEKWLLIDFLNPARGRRTLLRAPGAHPGDRQRSPVREPAADRARWWCTWSLPSPPVTERSTPHSSL